MTTVPSREVRTEGHAVPALKRENFPHTNAFRSKSVRTEGHAVPALKPGVALANAPV